MLVILDDGARRILCDPLAIIEADACDEVPRALAAVQEALGQGRYVAGWLAYELGYILEPRLMANRSPGPLLRLGVFQAPARLAPSITRRAYAGPLTPEWDQKAYAQRFTRVKEYIASGDIYQANLSFRAHFRFLGEPRALYEQLRLQSGAAHCCFVDDGQRQILSLSPELFFDLSPQGDITVKPMKGTKVRNGEDEIERAELAASLKDRAENLMIVDLIRNDLSRIAQSGSVKVSNLFQVETYPTLHALVSTVLARKRSDAAVADVLRALFPCGSVTGAPKIRAMEILRELETSPRGAYCGAVGYFAPAPNNQFSARFNVAIRTLTICNGRGELGIGGGLVQDSTAEGEYAECWLKARFFQAGRRPLELIETLRHEGTFVRLDRHLARMQASAALLGLVFDVAQARDVLEEAATGCQGALRVRLTLDEEGVFHASVQPLAPNPAYWTYVVSAQPTDSEDQLLRHKTNWRELYDDQVRRFGTDEVVFCNQKGEITEGARSNIFVQHGDILLTPPLEAGVLPGVLRSELIAEGKAREKRLKPEDLAGEVFFGNSLRGLIAAKPS
jgi:para-aminobenzoate synthetase/4-amino-4-deoxychorismate lyase